MKARSIKFGPLVADPEDACAPNRHRIEVYIEPGDLWFGAFIPRDLRAVYFCPLPTIVIRWARGERHVPVAFVDPWGGR